MRRVYRLEKRQGPINWVFIHGWGSDSTLWDSLRDRLKSTLHSSFDGSHFAVDLPGFGESKNAETLDLASYLKQVESELPARCIVVGWSLGGMLATRLAFQKGSKVQALITLACNPSFVARHDWSAAMSEHTFEQFCHGLKENANKTWLRFCALQVRGCKEHKLIFKKLKQQSPPSDQTLKNWLQGLHWLNSIDNRQALKSLPIPSLHIFGEGDSLVPNEAVMAIKSLAKVDVELIEGAGHCLHLSKPDETARAIQGWVTHCQFEDQKQIDKRKIARSFGLAAKRYDTAAQLQKSVAQALLEFASTVSAWKTHKAGITLDLGCGTGYISQLLLKQSGFTFIGQTHLIGLDIAEPMVIEARRKTQCLGLTADAEYLPLKEKSCQNIVSSLAVQWCTHLASLCCEVQRVLLPGGYFLFSTLGPKTLFELKGAWANINGFQHVNSFKSLSHIKTAVVDSGLVIEKIESNITVMQFPSLLPILRDLKTIGAHNMNAGQNPGLTPSHHLKVLEAEYEQYRDADKQLPVTYEVIFVLAKKITN